MATLSGADRIEVAAEAMRDMAFPDMLKGDVRDLIGLTDEFVSELFDNAAVEYYAALLPSVQSSLDFASQYAVFARVIKKRFEKGVQ